MDSTFYSLGRSSQSATGRSQIAYLSEKSQYRTSATTASPQLGASPALFEESTDVALMPFHRPLANLYEAGRHGTSDPGENSMQPLVRMIRLTVLAPAALLSLVVQAQSGSQTHLIQAWPRSIDT
jgi:hypothetical protein